MMCDCGTVFQVNRLRETWAVMPDDAVVRVTYFACPLCGHVYRVSLTTEKTDGLLETVNRTVNHLENQMSLLRAGDDEGFRRLNEEVLATRKTYADSLTWLENEYPGEFYLGDRRPEDALCVSAKDQLWYRGPELG